VPADDGAFSDAAFYFDLASPECYLAAERVLQVLPTPLQWQPVLADRLGTGHSQPEADGAAWAARAHELQLQPLRLPREYPFDSRNAMLAATYAKNIGRTVAFAQAAFRQAFAGGHDLADVEYVLIAGAACEMHPNAILRALQLGSISDQLANATARAARQGVTRLPAVCVAGDVFHGEAGLDEAAALAV
jgi:2-hydroxychromene-2-carboxylate isomerase